VVDGEGMLDLDDCFVTSEPYALDSTDMIDSSVTIIGGALGPAPTSPEEMESFVMIDSGDLDEVLVTYEDGVPEGFDTEVGIDTGTLEDLLVTYSDGAPEAFDTSATVDTGSLDDVLIQYEQYAPEGVDSSCVIDSGTLE
jgi:spore coat protein CotH